MNFVPINQNGFIISTDNSVSRDTQKSIQDLKNIKLTTEFIYQNEGQDTIYEVFDFPFVIHKILNIVGSGQIEVEAQYSLPLVLDLNRIFVDFRDRFIIYTTEGVPAVLNDEAQDQLFNLSDEFDDESLTLQGQTFKTLPWIANSENVLEEKFWSALYKEQQTGWDLNEPSPCLVWSLNKFKFPKLRVAVLGCGKGHDAAHFASLGHAVTGFDFSQEALIEAKKLYGQSPTLNWAQSDVFNLSPSYFGQFDLVFEHTLFCAIDPFKRDLLVQSWSKLLSDQGQILGVFFVMPKTFGPPFGATELELQHRLKNRFRTDFWQRSRHSTPRRQGKELIVLATKV